MTLAPLKKRGGRWATAVLLSWLIISTGRFYPYYLTYFNEIVGGPENGLNYLVISDLDWGQDLPQLQQHVAENDIDTLYLSYFGTVPPELYGLHYRQLPAWPPRGTPTQHPFHPTYPLPGTYAISAANLVGSHFEDNPQLYSWFQEQPPEERLGNSIYIYTVPISPTLTPTPVNWVAHNVPLPTLPDSFITNTLKTNNIHPRWINAQHALLFPTGRMVLHLNDDSPLAPSLAQLLNQIAPTPQSLTLTSEQTTTFYEWTDGQTAVDQYLTTNPLTPADNTLNQPSTCTPETPLSHPKLGNTATFLGWQSLTPLTAGQPYQGLSVWRIEQPLDTPLSIFVHLLAADGTIIAQSDRFDVTHDYLQAGDTLIQQHEWQTPDTLPADACWLAIGLYRKDNLQRLTVSDPPLERLFIPLNR